MRKTVAAVTTSLLVTFGVIGTIQPAGTEARDERITCAAEATPTCQLLGQVDALLAPLQPVLAVGGPLLGELGPAIGSLAALSGQASSAQGAPLEALRGAAGSVLDQVEAVARPLDQLGAGAVVTGLTSSLRDLVAGLTSIVGDEPDGDAAAPAAPAALPAPAGDEPVASASTGTGFGAPLALGADAGVGAVSQRAVPDVPAGSALSLAPLDLPDFGLVTTPHATAKELATEAAARQLTSELVVPATTRVADAVPAPDDTRALQVLGAAGVLLLAAGLTVDRIRKTRHVIPS